MQDTFKTNSRIFFRLYNYLVALPKCTGFICVLSKLKDRVVIFYAEAICLNITAKNSGFMSLKLRLRSKFWRDFNEEKSKISSKEWSILIWLLEILSSKSYRDVRLVRIVLKSVLNPFEVNWLLGYLYITSKDLEIGSSSAYFFTKPSRSIASAYHLLFPFI